MICNSPGLSPELTADRSWRKSALRQAAASSYEYSRKPSDVICVMGGDDSDNRTITQPLPDDDGDDDADSGLFSCFVTILFRDYTPCSHDADACDCAFDCCISRHRHKLSAAKPLFQTPPHATCRHCSRCSRHENQNNFGHKITPSPNIRTHIHTVSHIIHMTVSSFF